ncbi:UBIQUITIN-60S ribosomal protein L40-2 [Anaeramoeba ignava]|uniref:UBIQUITIN-60S ribosomal protein L40-2 n=1 Tax=Anaeramoeba ignava TaxID=1746090 RepID=A0A9Q0LDE6_ANAIG|nr:UBIQUITIN-60S ribosomal protein L40-2 [Anaeramoeba ignava]
MKILLLIELKNQNNPISIKISSSKTISELKTCIESKTKIPKDQIILKFQKNLLNDDQKLNNLGLKNHSRIILEIKNKNANETIFPSQQLLSDFSSGLSKTETILQIFQHRYSTSTQRNENADIESEPIFSQSINGSNELIRFSQILNQVSQNLSIFFEVIQSTKNILQENQTRDSLIPQINVIHQYANPLKHLSVLFFHISRHFSILSFLPEQENDLESNIQNENPQNNQQIQNLTSHFNLLPNYQHLIFPMHRFAGQSQPQGSLRIFNMSNNSENIIPLIIRNSTPNIIPIHIPNTGNRVANSISNSISNSNSNSNIHSNQMETEPNALPFLQTQRIFTNIINPEILNSLFPLQMLPQLLEFISGFSQPQNNEQDNSVSFHIPQFNLFNAITQRMGIFLESSNGFILDILNQVNQKINTKSEAQLRLKKGRQHSFWDLVFNLLIENLTEFDFLELASGSFRSLQKIVRQLSRFVKTDILQNNFTDENVDDVTEKIVTENYPIFSIDPPKNIQYKTKGHINYICLFSGFFYRITQRMLGILCKFEEEEKETKRLVDEISNLVTSISLDLLILLEDSFIGREISFLSLFEDRNLSKNLNTFPFSFFI